MTTLQYFASTKFIIVTAFSISLMAASVADAQWSVPIAGNTFRTDSDAGSRIFNRDGTLRISDENEVYSVYFHVDRPEMLKLGVQAKSEGGSAKITARVGEATLTTKLEDQPARTYPLGEVKVDGPGYVEVRLQCSPQNDTVKIKLDQLLVSCGDEDLSLDYVQNNDGNMFYWGRRGPSVHLSYRLPTEAKLTYAYSEITVPEGQDPIGSYFMANGFGEGYFGFQVNSETQRRVLFSVWSPFRTDNPKEIPESDRVLTTAKGKGVSAQDFGNEGSGGQSYLVYPWIAGATYRFLTEVKPDGNGNTQYTSWFGDKSKNEWRLIASFRRPKTDKHLTGFHSFLENFAPETGHIQRSAHYANQWVRDVEGEWHEITRAKFTGDNTARGRHRLDFAGGSEQDHFFLQNCGFFDATVKLDQIFERASTTGEQPEIDFDALPRG
ncbi:putative secreted protein [Rhodopirellula maiorica SM1]|uniref:Putative secreted protein n=1 Tax=Rhodopirellula maiorica SM1 TaxID=1265738 RepID=M5RP84_9BACT|nr:DUF3472 domain-containing protein [Rhodopirellula maiorica]EMI21021.1 putative secreted protein [Rhodopirellula maiorica SM1]